MNSNKSPQFLPPYLDFIYGHIYNDPDMCQKEDSLFMSNCRSFFQYKKLVNALNKELNSNRNVLQLGISFGNQIEKSAQLVNSLYQYDILDICKNEIDRATEKYSKDFKNIQFLQGDARYFNFEQIYDTVICFMLLSQVPATSKKKIINNALNLVNKGGKVIFIDWHKPLPHHPLRYLVRMYNRLKHPFVEKLWDKDINTFAGANLRSQFSWKKTTYFGRMFQKCVATRKEDPIKMINGSNSEYLSIDQSDPMLNDILLPDNF